MRIILEFKGISFVLPLCQKKLIPQLRLVNPRRPIGGTLYGQIGKCYIALTPLYESEINVKKSWKLLLCFPFVLMVSCGWFANRNDELLDDGYIHVTGDLDRAVASAVLSSSGADMITHIDAIPLFEAAISTYMIDYAEQFTIGGDGTFDIGLTPEQPWLLALKNINAVDSRDIYQGVLALAMGSESLLYFPIDVATGDIALGDLVPDGDEYAPANESTDFTALFDAPLDSLQLLARFDGMGKFVKNYYTNFNYSSGVGIGADVFVNYHTTDSIIGGAFYDPSQYEKDRYAIGFEFVGGTMFNAADITSGTSLIEVLPPEGSTVYGHDERIPYTYDSPVSTSGSYVTSDRDYGQIEYLFDNYNINFYADEVTGDIEYIGVWLEDDMPIGTWTLRENGTEVAWQDVTAVDEMDSQGKFTIFVPVARFDFDDNGVLERLEIKFVYFDEEVGAYRDMLDYSVIEAFIDRPMISLRDFLPDGGDLEERIVSDTITPFEPGTVVATSFENAWTSDPVLNPGAHPIEQFGVVYNYGAISIAFVVEPSYE